ncbi:hypothetical protein D0T53_02920 [Dysgonomonas sp. 216]|uniref:Cbp1 family collagen-binding glycoprotein adhesin n=1 Tax=Dysgonomonas sp. 216 TaxID=2302934 RepID=UPI0013D401F3|nr:hypothetical protein [Dysgonomonas sp. 216]NDW17869.1 hypothetical protein [Dysgonomonas sp. 216]
MKKLFFLLFAATALVSCNVKNSDEYKALQAKNDSLMQVNEKGGSELAEVMGIINDVEENFNQIKEAEKYLTVQSQGKGEMTSDTKTRVQENFQMINDILKKNKTDIEALNKRLKNSSGEVSTLKTTIERLNTQLTERANAIVKLQSDLASRDKQIMELTSNVHDLTQNVENLSTQVESQASTIKEQDTALNTAYYMFGTSSELKDAKVVKGGFLSSPKVMKESIDKSIFIKIDIRNVKAIPVYAKKAKVLSEHPSASYKLDKDANGQVVLNISDYQKFWSLTQFLIIEVN